MLSRFSSCSTSSGLSHRVSRTASLCTVDAYGELGIGSKTTLKEPPTEPIDLGSDFPVDSACNGEHHVCAKSVNGTTKC